MEDVLSELVADAEFKATEGSRTGMMYSTDSDISRIVLFGLGRNDHEDIIENVAKATKFAVEKHSVRRR